MNQKIWKNMPVFITGHTGFKGGWLSLCLNTAGARLHGYALDPPTQPSIFEICNLENIFNTDVRNDICDYRKLCHTIEECQPKIIFHLAAQPIVRQSYNEPRKTFETNTMGTINILEAARRSQSVKAIVVVTTDKVYENKELVYPYREIDPLGGHDPYSASKAAAEIVTASYRQSFFQDKEINIATARAGNVIGGGDWAIDRLFPDMIRGFIKDVPVKIRNPHSIRPWQHVLEPLSGYIKLGERLLSNDGKKFAKSWNFGPFNSEDATVEEVAKMVSNFWGKKVILDFNPVENDYHEAKILKLDISQARDQLQWVPRYNLAESVKMTIKWYRAWVQKENMRDFTISQIQNYLEKLNHGEN